MNNEVVKAMNRKPKEKSAFKKWWNKNDYKVWRIILFPIWIYQLCSEKINLWLNSRNNWSEARAAEILSYYIPRYSEWDKEDKSFFFFDNGYGWGMHFAKKYLKCKDRRFWKVNTGWNGGKIRSYLIDNFELEGFTKEVRYCSDSYTEIVFKMKETED